QRMNDEGTALVGEPRQILEPWLRRQNNLIEGPEMFRGDNGEVYLMVASGHQDGYAEDIARAKSPMGPFEVRDEPMSSNSRHFVDTGHASKPFYVNGVLVTVEHAQIAGW